jgi:hypothetical protein
VARVVSKESRRLFLPRTSYSLLCPMFLGHLCFSRACIECFPGIAPKYFFGPLVTIPVAPMTAGKVIRLLLLLYSRDGVILRHCL